MSVIGTIAAVLVGLVFVVAGASKLAAGERWPAQARDLGAPAWVARLLPWTELVVGALLIVQLFVPWPAVAAMVMLLGFSTLLALRLQDADRPSCACFGQWSDSEIGVGHLVRNGVFFALAVLALFA
jgi:uncharacterized membrane protein YphA (DoxX/SURF4 family)